MVRISARDLADELIHDCLLYGDWSQRTADALVERALDPEDPYSAEAASRALFGVVIERLADLFDPGLCDVYARLFTRVIARVLPETNAAELYTRYNRIRTNRRFVGGEISRVFVLSRITLGADVAVTSVVLDAAKQRFPDAEISFVGPEKNAELFSADTRITSVVAPYGRNSGLQERIVAATELRSLIDVSGSIVIDPDSRLTQLGLIPVCDDSRYYFFESRAFGGQSDLNLPALTALWLSDVFGVDSAAPYLAPQPQPHLADYCVSFGIGDNEEKRVSSSFERELLRMLLAKGKRVLLDRGSGPAESAAVSALQEQLASDRLLIHEGPYASFASHITQSRFYVGYDSAGQHVASACGVPLLSVFKGYASDRMFDRWRPVGENATVIAVKDQSEDELLAEAAKSINRLA